MDQVLPLIWVQYGGFWLLVAVAAAYIIARSGMIGHLFLTREGVAQRLATDRQHFTETLIRELADVRERHRRDMEEIEGRLTEAHRRADDERINAQRWRHLIGSLGVFIMAQRHLLEKHGIEAPRFDWSSFVEGGGDPRALGEWSDL